MFIYIQWPHAQKKCIDDFPIAFAQSDLLSNNLAEKSAWLGENGTKRRPDSFFVCVFFVCFFVCVFSFFLFVILPLKTENIDTAIHLP